ncbi:MAG: hypothetical protein NT175_09975 [Bacteroidetes bacterium]|nr:hypothetical protein [Bacteroidota bacterium]
MNDKEIILEVIQQTLEAITEQDTIIRNHKGQIPQIELDIIMDNIRKLYENYHQLNDQNREEKIRIQETFKQKKQPAPRIVSNEPNISEVQVEAETDENRPLKIIDIGFSKKEENEVLEKANHTEEKDAPEEDIMPENSPGIPEELEKTTDEFTLDLFSEQTVTLADKLKSSQKTVSDKFSKEKEDKSLAAKMQKTPIADIKSFIGINDRFIFMNELFGGNMKVYDDCINKLNTFTEFDEAMTYFRWMKEHYGLNDKLESYKRLLEFIHRKYQK